MTSPRLEVAGLSHDYAGEPALHDVHLAIAPGEILAVVGPNGAGKTTLISVVAGLVRPRAGVVRLDGADLRPGRRPPRSIGLVPQELGIYPTLPVATNLRYFCELAGVPAAERPARVDRLAEMLMLTHLLDRRAGALSGGEKRRLHTALGVVAEPRLLLLDEPTVGADVETRSRILDVVRSLAGAGMAVCYTTHYLAELDVLDPSVAILDQGRVRAWGPRQEVLRAARSSSVEDAYRRIVGGRS